MGNGAGVQSSTSPSRSRYARLERLCRSEYFLHDPAAYTHALTEAIREDALDCLELLLVSGDIRRAQPLHLACSLGKLEAVELMLSAGFNGEQTNRESRTPLHLCALCVPSAEAGLCASVMAMRCPRTTRRLDYLGLSPLHLAAESDNVSVLRALLQVDDTLLGSPSQSGETALQIAERRRKSKAAEYLRFVSAQQQQQQQQQQIGASQSQRHTGGEADMERIMEVWERFFENAFKMAGGMMYGSDSDSDSESGGEEEHKEHKQWYDERLYEREANNNSTSDDWLWWLVCYDYDDAESYFVLHTWTGETQWLDDFTNYTCYERGYLCSYEDQYNLTNQEASSHYPESLAEAERCGWLPFFDQRDNSCQWMNIFRGSFEYYLPLGLKGNWETLQGLGLQFCEEDTCWFCADQRVTHAWVVVVPSDADRDFYYLNTITSGTQWEPPNGWEDLLLAWNGWTLCCMEDNIDQRFWFDPVSGESVWTES